MNYLNAMSAKLLYDQSVLSSQGRFTQLRKHNWYSLLSEAPLRPKIFLMFKKLREPSV